METDRNGSDRNPETRPDRKPIGFARMDADKIRMWGSAGGRRAHAVGHAHQWTREEAAEAGRKGGTVTAAKRQVVPIVNEEDVPLALRRAVTLRR